MPPRLPALQLDQCLALSATCEYSCQCQRIWIENGWICPATCEYLCECQGTWIKNGWICPASRCASDEDIEVRTIGGGLLFKISMGQHCTVHGLLAIASKHAPNANCDIFLLVDGEKLVDDWSLLQRKFQVRVIQVVFSQIDPNEKRSLRGSRKVYNHSALSRCCGKPTYHDVANSASPRCTHCHVWL